MKKAILFLMFLFILLGCSKPSDCVESAGSLVSKEYNDFTFDKVIVYQGISLVVTQGPTCKVEVKTGENLIGDIDVKVNNGTLILKDNTTCNWVREYGQTTIYITAPNMTDFISKTEKNISSNGVLTFPIIRLQALDLSDGAGTGDFNFQIDNNQLVIENNNVSNYYISGKTKQMLASFYEGNGRLEANNCITDNISVFQRGSNDMVLFPTTTITGDIYSTGNVICKNYPTTAPNVTQHYKGKLIFN